MALQWIGLCVAAAMVCALLRPQRPELATVISLAVGVAVFSALAAQVRTALPTAERLNALLSGLDGEVLSILLRAAGITVIAELGSQLCRDAGERALAGRVALIARVAILALCMPVVSRLVELLWRLAS